MIFHSGPVDFIMVEHFGQPVCVVQIYPADFPFPVCGPVATSRRHYGCLLWRARAAVRCPSVLSRCDEQNPRSNSSRVKYADRFGDPNLGR